MVKCNAQRALFHNPHPHLQHTGQGTINVKSYITLHIFFKQHTCGHPCQENTPSDSFALMKDCNRVTVGHICRCMRKAGAELSFTRLCLFSCNITCNNELIYLHHQQAQLLPSTMLAYFSPEDIIPRLSTYALHMYFHPRITMCNFYSFNLCQISLILCMYAPFSFNVLGICILK